MGEADVAGGDVRGDLLLQERAGVGARAREAQHLVPEVQGPARCAHYGARAGAVASVHSIRTGGTPGHEAPRQLPGARHARLLGDGLDQSVRSKRSNCLSALQQGQYDGPIGPAASLDPLLSSAHRDLL